MKNGKNTDLNNQKVEFEGPLQSQKWPRMNLPRVTTNLYVEEYQDITLNTNLGKIKA